MTATPAHEDVTMKEIGRRLKVAASRRAEEMIAEVPAAVRWLRRLAMVLAISVPILVIGSIVVLWHLAS